MSTIRLSPRRLGILGTLTCASALVAQAPPPREPLLISAADLAARAKDADLLLLHVTDRQAAFDDEHIPRARFVRYGDIAVDGDGLGSELPPLDAIDRALEAVGVSDASRIVVYGTSTVAAARLFFTLDVLGHARVALLDGGLRAWKAEGRPTARGSESASRPSASPGTAKAVPYAQAPRDARGFSSRLNSERLAGAEWIQQRVGTSQINLVDVRPDPEFTGSDGGMRGAHVAGHIAGARQLPWDSLVDATGRFLPASELRAKLDAIGIARDKPVISYCMVGMRASVVYFVARYLGYDARLYDGSIVDWGRRGLPTKTGR
jgi:thiosulfate/3-mercaptopyruvate sulfurtransferase